MERAKFGCIQSQSKRQEQLDNNSGISPISFERREQIYNVAVEKGKKIWPTKVNNQKEQEIATRWVF